MKTNTTIAAIAACFTLLSIAGTADAHTLKPLTDASDNKSVSSALHRMYDEFRFAYGPEIRRGSIGIMSHARALLRPRCAGEDC